MKLKNIKKNGEMAEFPNYSVSRSERPIEVSIVMPCLNEAETLKKCIDKARIGLRANNILGEIIVSDNGSLDQSVNIAINNGAKVVVVQKRGYGSAIKAGVSVAVGQFVIMGDSDDSYDFSDILNFLLKLRLGDELVMGNRFLGGIKPGAMPWSHKFIGNPFLTFLVKILFFVSVNDAHCGLRAFRKDSFFKWNLVSDGMEFASEMVIKAKLFGAKISEVPVILYPDGRNRAPHLNSLRDGFRHLFLILKLRLFTIF